MTEALGAPAGDSGEVFDSSLIEIVARGHNLYLSGLDQLGHESAFGADLNRRPLGTFANRVVDEIKHRLSSGLRILQSAGFKQPTNIFTRYGCAAPQRFPAVRSGRLRGLRQVTPGKLRQQAQ